MKKAVQLDRSVICAGPTPEDLFRFVLGQVEQVQFKLRQPIGEEVTVCAKVHTVLRTNDINVVDLRASMGGVEVKILYDFVRGDGRIDLART